jgi:triacylglycerol esterase/lipase EstA (alpha/beta hydrolase family)
MLHDNLSYRADQIPFIGSILIFIPGLYKHFMKAFFITFLLIFSVQIRAQHIVLISGINNEQVRDYFTSFEAYLRSKNFQLVTRFNPSSLNTVTGNASYLRTKLLSLYKAHGEPLIIIAHSKGGLELANAMGRFHSDFPEKVIAKAVFVNTPFAGSPYMAESIREYEATWGNFGNQYNPVYLNTLNVLQSLGTQRISDDLHESFKELSVMETKLMTDRFFFIRTQKAPEKVSSVLRKSAEYLRGTGPNDGLIPVENQKWTGHGKDLGIQDEIDHIDFFVRKWKADSQVALRMDVLLKAIFP